MSETPLLPVAVHDAAVHGSYCPKLCTFACPVTEATGRDDAVPWSLHRTVVEVSAGTLAPQDAAPRLTACSGCLGCQVPCQFDQDVPAQVLAARAVAPPDAPSAVEAREHLAAGRRPDGTTAPGPIGVRGATTVVFAGHQDTEPTMQATLALFEAAGVEVAVVAPSGCCGGLARALGDPDLGDDLRSGVSETVGDAPRIVALDPHCLPELRAALPDREVTDVMTALAEHLEALHFDGPRTPVVWHDPCVLSRGEGVLQAPRDLLAAAGFEVVEPEFSGVHTACSGAGMGLPLVAPDAAARTAERRSAHLRSAGDTVATGCSRAASLLGDAGTEIATLVELLAARLENR